MHKKQENKHPLNHFRFCPECGSNNFEEYTKNSKKCSDCNYEHFQSPSIGCSGIIFDNQNRLLCIRRAKELGIGMLGFPGGFVDINETLEQALIREVMEETGIKIEVGNMIANIPNSYVYKGIEQYPLDVYFSGTIINMDNIKNQEQEVSEILFIPRNKIDPNQFAFYSARKVLMQILKQNSNQEQE